MRPTPEPTNAATDNAILVNLKPGDVLLYARTSLFNRIISVKTWSRFTHVEIVGLSVQGKVQTYASRNNLGVDVYTPDLKGLALVRRPVLPCGCCTTFDFEAARQWFYHDAIGQRYDWLGLLNFAYARRVGNDNRAMFCSEFAARFLRRGGLDLFPENDADEIAPRDFSVCPCLATLWRSPAEIEKFNKGVV